MLGYDDSKDGGLLFDATNQGRWAWLRTSKKTKAALAGALLAAGGLAWALMMTGSEPKAVYDSSPVAAVAAACATAAWGQCGGKAFSADSCCPEGHTCTYRTEDYSQCVPDCLCAASGVEPWLPSPHSPGRAPEIAKVAATCI